MDRMESLVAQVVAARRAFQISIDTETDPALRCDRAEIVPGCPLKNDDDVMVSGSLVRVICPAGAPGWFHSMTLMESGFVPGSHEVQYVTERAPADPEEEPGEWPWVPPEAP